MLEDMWVIFVETASIDFQTLSQEVFSIKNVLLLTMTITVENLNANGGNSGMKNDLHRPHLLNMRQEAGSL